MNISFRAVICYMLATLFLGYEMALQVSPAVMVTELIKDIGLNAHTLSIISAAYFCAYATMQIPAGIMFDRYSAKLILTTAVVICTIGIYVFVLTKSALLLALGRFITGFGSAFAFVGVLIMANEWFPEKNFPILVGIAQLIAALGAMFGELPLAISIENHGWQSAVVGLTFIGVILSILIAIFIKNNYELKKDDITDQSIDIKSDLKLILTNKYNWAIALYAFTCWGPVTSFAELWGVEFLRHHLEISKNAAAGVTSSIWVGIALGAPILGYISGKKKIFTRLLQISSIIGFLATFLLVFGPINNIYFAHFLAICFGIAASSQILTFSMIKNNTPAKLAGTAIGFMNMAVVAGGTILQPLIGALIQFSWDGYTMNGIPWYTSNDYQQALSVIPICYLVSVVTSLYILNDKNN
jgi:MFS family permease